MQQKFLWRIQKVLIFRNRLKNEEIIRIFVSNLRKDANTLCAQKYAANNITLKAWPVLHSGLGLTRVFETYLFYILLKKICKIFT